jgi:hypothetical protein
MSDGKGGERSRKLLGVYSTLVSLEGLISYPYQNINKCNSSAIESCKKT